MRISAGTRITHSGFGEGTVAGFIGGRWSGVDRYIVDFDKMVNTNPGNYRNRYRTSVWTKSVAPVGERS